MTVSLDPERIIERVRAAAPGASGYWVAFSGGVDSSVLLDLLAEGREQLPAPLAAVHVHHGLQAEADAWAEHCAERAARLGLPLVRLAVDARAAPGASPEAAAREARYRVLADWLPAGGALLSAHHRDDQAETLLLQLLRGAGPDGLAGMPAVASLGRGVLLRPLLDVPRTQLEARARVRSLVWSEDPSNADRRFDRNYIRHELLPMLETRWPAARAVIARAAGLQAEASRLLAQVAEQDLAVVAGRVPGTLDCERLLALDADRQRNLLRHWLRRAGLRLPSQRVLEHLRRTVPAARPDAMPVVRWAGGEVRRHRGLLYAMAPLPAPALAGRHGLWHGETLKLPELGGTLQWMPGEGVDASLIGAGLRLELRRGGERLRAVGRREHQSLKHLLQAAGIPPWERERLPLLYAGDRLVAVPSLWVAEGCQGLPGGRAGMPRWSRLEPFVRSRPD
ncbi:tRNA lysidine(34) synthetase TilS [Thiohalobacter sp.]|uniref:tRNA lysidine(34) synthetase TilS n=1 Tax=Thiohalobacter sp. TaxID=2025948 RepID=UPI0026020F47|nr:tRNA lysidine(34) synthetase TilS [Thiohalobacter sp.]